MSELFKEIKDEVKRAFLLAYMENGNINKSAEIIKRTRMTIWIWRRDDEQFLAAFKVAEEIFHFNYANELERLLGERARDSTAQMSTVALFFALKAEMPDKYREKEQAPQLPSRIIFELATPQYAKNVYEFEELERKLLKSGEEKSPNTTKDNQQLQSSG